MYEFARCFELNGQLLEKDTTKDDQNAVLVTYVYILLWTWKSIFMDTPVSTTLGNIEYDYENGDI